MSHLIRKPRGQTGNFGIRRKSSKRHAESSDLSRPVELVIEFVHQRLYESIPVCMVLSHVMKQTYRDGSIVSLRVTIGLRMVCPRFEIYKPKIAA